MPPDASTFDYLMEVSERRGAGYLTLLDPDRMTPDELEARALVCAAAGADALLVGTSLMFSSNHQDFLGRLKDQVAIPVISFPGSAAHVSPLVDAILFLSMISGRNPDLLIGQQAKAAPLLREYGTEVISTGYMLIESGTLSSVEYMSNTRPIPSGKADIAMAHALAAEYIGMKMIYLEAGSGAARAVPTEMVRAVVDYISLPVIVGGGIRDGETAAARVAAGARFIVTGSAVETEGNGLESHLRELRDAVRVKG